MNDDTPEKEHIVMLKKALQRMYQSGYDATCDAIEDTLSEREDLLKRVTELEELYKCRDGEVAALASLNQGQFLELEYLRPIFVAVEKILFMAEEYDFDDGLGRGAPQEYWDALENAFDKDNKDETF